MHGETAKFTWTSIFWNSYLYSVRRPGSTKLKTGHISETACFGPQVKKWWRTLLGCIRPSYSGISRKPLHLSQYIPLGSGFVKTQEIFFKT